MERAARDAFMRAFVDQYRAVHSAIREQISDLDTATLNWIPCENANSIAVLVEHVTGSEIEAVRTLAGVESDRIRSQEFEVRGADAAMLLSLVDRADAILDQLTPAIEGDRLDADHVRAASLDRTPRSGVHVLMQSLAHAREHLGQLLLTRQLAARA